MYRKILAPIFGSPADRTTLAVGLGLAQRFSCHLEALFVRFEPLETQPFVPLGRDMSGFAAKHFIEAAIRAADEAQGVASTMFAEAIKETGVETTETPGAHAKPSAELRIVSGGMAECIERASRLSDLIVFCGEASDSNMQRAYDAVEGALLSGAKPVLFVSPTIDAGGISKLGQQLAIAFDGSATAAHAVTAALPFLKQAKTVHSFEVTDQKASANLAELKRYLALHGVEPAPHVISDQKGVDVALVDAVRYERCDLLVLGGYGHSVSASSSSAV
ncbi:MAG: hypothetical protein GC190_21480 [Alphaproteobacteria bacterium]|nr:hypothetical protein [Alphaproteobacteria bacterium]